MINTSQTYKQLFNERAIHDYRLLVDDVTYTHEDIKDSIVLQQNLFDKSTFTVGSFTIGVLKLKLTVPSDEIPHNASVVFSYRYNNGEMQSEWIDKFKGNITKRTIHGDALTEIEVKDKASNYDKFLDYFGESLTKYPANTREVANLCASHLGLEIDNIEDVINLDIVEYPNENTMVEMLKEIATNSGGNWTIVGDKLRLVTTGEKLELTYPARSIKENALLSPISKVLIYYANLTAFESGTDTGSTLEADSKWGTQESADYVHSILNGYEYKPLKVTSAYADPALELGDIVTIADKEVLMANVKWEFDGSATVDVEVPINGEINYDDPYSKMMQAQFDRKVTLGDSYQGVTISRDKGIEMLVSPDGTEDNATGRYYADLYRGIAFQTRNNTEEDWRDWLYFDIEDKKFKLMLDGNETLEEKLVSIDVDLDGVRAEVYNMNFGSILLNGSGEEGNMNFWSFPPTNYPLKSRTGLMAVSGLTNYSNFDVIEDERSMSGFKLSFFSNGMATNGLFKVFNEYLYAYRVRRLRGQQPFTLEINEFNQNHEYISKQTFILSDGKEFETLENIKFGEDTWFVSLTYIINGVSLNNRLELSETMFNIGVPKPYVKNADGVYQWAKSMLDLQANLLEAVFDEVDYVDNKINNTTVKVTAKDGVEIWNNNGKGLTLYDDKNEKSMELTSDGRLVTRDMLAENATITGNLAAGKIAGLIFDDSKISFPDGELVLNSGKNAIEFGNTLMRFWDNSTDGQGILIGDGSGYWDDGVFIHAGGGIRAKRLEPTISEDGDIQDLDIIGVNYLSTHRMVVGNQITPMFSNVVDLGSSSSRFKRIYLNEHPNVSSDLRYKYAIQDIPQDLIEEISKVEPKMYLQGDKWHFGYIAQDIERALYKWATKEFGKDAKYYVDKFAFLHKDESYLSLLYGEIAVLKERAMNERIDKLENDLQEIKELLKERND